MLIKSLTVKNFRSILDETLCFDKITALVGANGSGKSSFLHALELFYATQPKIIPDDFYNKNTDNEITFSITFKDLSVDAKTKFSRYLRKDELTVERVFNFAEGKINFAYHGSTLQNPEFREIRYNNATKARPVYEQLRQKTRYDTLPRWQNRDDAITNLNQWEDSHSDQCEWISDDGKFFGFSDVASGYLAKYIKILYIPAVRDASLDATEGKNSALADLIDIVIRNELMQKKEIQEFQKEFTEQYKKIFGTDTQKNF